MLKDHKQSDFFEINIQDNNVNLVWNKDGANLNQFSFLGSENNIININIDDNSYLDELLTIIKSIYINRNQNKFDEFLLKAYEVSDLDRQRKIDQIMSDEEL